MINKQRAVLVVAGLFTVVVLLSGCDDDGNGTNGSSYEEGLFAINGLYYKSEMGESQLDPLLYFAVRDADGVLLPDKQVHLDLIEGDAGLSWRSVMTDSTGKAHVTYTFSGELGHAVIRGFSNDGDTVYVNLRANTLIPGGHGQGQYILYDDDTYADVISLNGSPQSTDIYDNHDIIYMDYEDSLGVVVMLNDSARNYHVYDTTSVYGVIVNTIYEKKTPEGIGIGSPIDSLRDSYGDPERIRLIDNDILVEYRALGFDFYCNSDSDTTVIEIHMFHPRVPVESAGRSQGVLSVSQKTYFRSEYHLHQD